MKIELQIKEIEYVTAQSLSLLRKEVEEMIRIGWEPYGGIVIDNVNPLHKYIQSMISWGFVNE